MKIGATGSSYLTTYIPGSRWQRSLLSNIQTPDPSELLKLDALQCRMQRLRICGYLAFENTLSLQPSRKNTEWGCIRKHAEVESNRRVERCTVSKM
jgi:hypothetical protein